MVTTVEITPHQHTIVTEPVYQQLTRALREEMESGKYKPGDKFPSERKIAETFGVSRVTANKVISNMVAEGLLQFRPGIGTFMAEAKGLQASLRQMKSFTEHAQARGFTPHTQVLTFRPVAIQDIPESVRLGLGQALDTQEKIIFVERLRSADGVPVILEYRWILEKFVPGIADTDLQGSFYALLENRYQIVMTGENHRILARNLDAEEAKKLSTKRGAATLMVEGPGFTGSADNLQPVWYQRLFYRGDQYELQNELRTNGHTSSSTIQFRKKEMRE